MVDTINPVVHGGRRIAWARDVALHAAGATTAAALFGGLLGVLGAVLGAPWGAGGMTIVAGVALAYGLAEAAGRRLPVPQARRQVPDWWRTLFSRPVYSFLYGTGLGVGFLTYLSRGTLVAVAAGALVSGRPIVGAVVLAPFGLARAAGVLVASHVRSVDDATGLVERLAARSGSRWWSVANAAALLAVAAAAGVASWRARDLGVARLAPAVLGVAFGGAAASKALAPAAWRTALRAHELPVPLERLVRPAVPIAEAIVATTALLGATVAAGWGAIAMLSLFSVVAVRTRVRGGRMIECGCFGGRRAIDVRVLLGRNAALTGVAAVTLAGRAGARLAPPTLPTGREVLPAALAVIGLAVAVWAAARVSAALGGGRRA